jgi:hypothetical protein
MSDINHEGAIQTEQPVAGPEAQQGIARNTKSTAYARLAARISLDTNYAPFNSGLDQEVGDIELASQVAEVTPISRDIPYAGGEPGRIVPSRESHGDTIWPNYPA